MQAYFLAVNGTNDNWADDCLLAFWPLQKVKPASEPAGLFIFADHSVSACEYAIRLSQTESEPCPVVVIGGPEPRVVADSFSEFVEIYLTGDFAKLLP
jgi:hypothetical protein